MKALLRHKGVLLAVVLIISLALLLGDKPSPAIVKLTIFGVFIAGLLVGNDLGSN